MASSYSSPTFFFPPTFSFCSSFLSLLFLASCSQQPINLHLFVGFLVVLISFSLLKPRLSDREASQEATPVLHTCIADLFRHSFLFTRYSISHTHIKNWTKKAIYKHSVLLLKWIWSCLHGICVNWPIIHKALYFFYIYAVFLLIWQWECNTLSSVYTVKPVQIHCTDFPPNAQEMQKHTNVSWYRFKISRFTTQNCLKFILD